MSNEIIFLGTGTSQGVPVIGSNHPVCLSQDPRDKRLRAAVFIKTPQAQILIDCGPDFRQQMLREGLDDLDGILVTHEHNDHIIGLDDVRPIYFKRHQPPKIYALPRVLKEIKSRFPYAFTVPKYPGVPSFDLIEVESSAFDINGVEILPLPVSHGELSILGYRIGNLAYLTDVSYISNETLEKLKGLEILIIDALRKDREHHSHLTLEQAIVYAQKINPKKTYFTHMSYEIGFHANTSQILPQNMYLAYDGLCLKFN